MSYRLTTAADELAEFYDKMYLPYAERRFGSLSVVDSRDEVIRVARRGTLLQVLHENRVVSAAVLVGHKRTIHFFWLGLPDGLDPRLLDAALSGLYFYTIRYAHAQGYRDLDLSYTAPLLNDGVYRYKRKWGAAVHDEWTIDELLLRPLNLAPGVASFFVHQPAMTRERGGLAAKVLLSDEDVSPGAITDLVEHYASAGMQSLKICSLRPFGSEVRGRSYGDGVPVELIELAHAADPAAAFCAC